MYMDFVSTIHLEQEMKVVSVFNEQRKVTLGKGDGGRGAGERDVDVSRTAFIKIPVPVEMLI